LFSQSPALSNYRYFHIHLPHIFQDSLGQFFGLLLQHQSQVHLMYLVNQNQIQQPFQDSFLLLFLLTLSQQQLRHILLRYLSYLSSVPNSNSSTFSVFFSTSVFPISCSSATESEPSSLFSLSAVLLFFSLAVLLSLFEPHATTIIATKEIIKKLNNFLIYISPFCMNYIYSLALHEYSLTILTITFC